MGTLHADQAAFEKANTLYKDGKHAEAAEAYLELSQTGVSANLLFNMGNAYFKPGSLAGHWRRTNGRSIWHRATPTSW